jgi:hypothetical protein
MSERVLGPTNLLFEGYRVVFPSVNLSGLEVDLSPTSGAEVKGVEMYIIPLVRLHDMERGKLYVTEAKISLLVRI